MSNTYFSIQQIDTFRQGSNERDSSSPTERVSPVILSEAKDLSAERETVKDSSSPLNLALVMKQVCYNGRVLFLQDTQMEARSEQHSL